MYVTGNRAGTPAGFTEFYGEIYDGKSWQSLPKVNFKGSSGELHFYNNTVYLGGNFTDVLGYKAPAGKFTAFLQLKGSAWDTVANGDLPNNISTASIRGINSGIYILESIITDSTKLHRFIPGQGILSTRRILIDTAHKGFESVTLKGQNNTLFVYGEMKSMDGVSVPYYIRFVNDIYVSTNLSGAGSVIRGAVDYNGDIVYMREFISGGGPHRWSNGTNTNIKYNLQYVLINHLLPRNGEMWYSPTKQSSLVFYDAYIENNGTYWHSLKMQKGQYWVYVSEKLGYFSLDMSTGIWRHLEMEPGGAVSGRCYADLDKNCSYSASNDTLLRNAVVTLKSATDEYSCMTDQQGKYYMVLPLDSFVFKQTHPDFTVNTCSKKYVVTDTSSSDTIDISLYPKYSDDMELKIIAGSVTRLDDIAYYQIRIKNKGLKTRNVLLTLKYDKRQVYSSSSVSPLTNNPGVLTWRFTNVKPLSEKLIKLKLNVPFDSFVLGDSLLVKGWLDTMTGEDDTMNNIDSIRQKIIYSYDPNAKSSDKDGNAYWGLKKIRYYIQFQNEGNDYARNVVVQDTLPPQIQTEGMEFLGASHPCKMTLINGVFTFTFADIMLQPKSVNEPLSNGWISFDATLKPGLPVGTNIKNKAQIYFDRNPAVITNYSSVLIVNYPASQKKIAGSSTQLSLYPNPAQNSFTVVNPLNRDLSLELFDLNGRKMLDQIVKAKNSVEINIAGLTTGMYILRSPIGSQKVFKN